MFGKRYIALSSTTVPPAAAETVEEAKRRTRALSIREGSLWAIMWGMGESYIQAFAIFLCAGNRAVALIATVPLLLGAFAQLLMAVCAERWGRRRGLILVVTMVQGLGYLPFFWAPYFFRDQAVPFAVFCGTMILFLGSSVGPVWLSLMGDVIPAESRGRYFARRNRLIFAAMVASLLCAGGVLSFAKAQACPWLGFGLLFMAACAARVYASWLFTRHYDQPARAVRGDYFSFWDFIRRTPHSNFAKFAFTIALLTGATNIAGPFFGMYMLRDLHWTYLQFTMSTVMLLVGQFLFVPWWGQICDRHGTRSVLMATCFVLPVLPVVWAVTTSYPVLLVQQVISGCTWSGFNLAATNFILDAVTPQKRARATSYYNILNGFFSLVGGSVVGAFLAENLAGDFEVGPIRVHLVSSLPLVFIISGLVRALVGVLMLRRFKEVREAAAPVSPGHLLWRLTKGEPIAVQVEQMYELIAAPLRRRGRRTADGKEDSE